MKCDVCSSDIFFHYCYVADEEVRVYFKCISCNRIREIKILGLTDEERKRIKALSHFCEVF